MVHRETPVLTSEAARILDVTPAGVRAMERRGCLTAVRTASGVRLFDRGAVEQLARQRAEHKALACAGAK
jgi:DNA-binding transcriptional MerR regulator